MGILRSWLAAIPLACLLPLTAANHYAPTGRQISRR